LAKKIFTLIFALCVTLFVGALCVSAEEVASGTCGKQGNNLTWALDENGVLTIKGTGNMADYTSTTPAPWYEFRSTIYKISIDDGITNIGNYAFSRCEKAQEVLLSDTISTIGRNAFQYCFALEAFDFKNVQTIEIGAFINCHGLKKIELGEKVKSVGLQAFAACASVETVLVPKSVESIGKLSFGIGFKLRSITVDENNEYFTSDSCGVLFDKNKTTLIQYPCASEFTTYTIPESVISIADGAFQRCNNLTKFVVASNNTCFSTDEKGVLFNKDKTRLIQYPCGRSDTDYTIPSTVNVVGISAFEKSTKLSNLRIENGVESCDYNAFSLCHSLSTITFPESFKTFGFGSLQSCSNLKEVIIYNPSATFDQYIFSNCHSDLTLYGYVGSTTETYANANNIPFVALEEPEILYSGICGKQGNNLTWTLDENGLLTISGEGEMADWESESQAPWYPHKSSIKKIIFENGVTSIGNYAFRFYPFIPSINFPNSVTSIGELAFGFCHGLTDIEIPPNIINIDESAFYYCTSIKGFTVDSNNAYYSNDERGALFNKNKTTLLRYPMGNNATSYTIIDSVTSIGNSLYHCKNLESITVDSSNAHYSNDEKGVLFNKSKTTLIQYPAANTATYYTIPDSVTNIGVYSFEDCENLTSIDIPNNVMRIEPAAFQGCSALKSATIGNNVTYIGDSAFYLCSSLESIDIPDNVKSIGYQAFGSCSNLEIVKIFNKNVKFESNGVFRNSPNLTLYGYTGSTTETYAAENNIPFKKLLEPGDIDGSGAPDNSDIVLLAEYILGDLSQLTENQLAAANLYTEDDGENGESVINVKDLINLAQIIAQNK